MKLSIEEVRNTNELQLSFGLRLKNAWNVFRNKNPAIYNYYGASYGYRPDRVRLTRGNERSIVTSIFNRIATDVAAIKIRHVQLDDNDRYLRDVDSGLNNCL